MRKYISRCFYKSTLLVSNTISPSIVIPTNTMLYKVAFLFTIGLIAICAGEGSQAAAEAVPDKVVEAVSENVVEVPVENHNSPAAVEAIPLPPKTCDSAENKKTQVSENKAVTCRGDNGASKCRDICGSLGFKLASCKTTSYKPRAVNASCVCSNDGKFGLVASEYAGPPSLRRTPGYFKNFFPLKAACNDCACNKVCEKYRMSPDDKGFAAYTKGSCVDRSCICLKAFHAEKEERLAKRSKLPQGPTHKN